VSDVRQSRTARRGTAVLVREPESPTTTTSPSKGRASRESTTLALAGQLVAAGQFDHAAALLTDGLLNSPSADTRAVIEPLSKLCSIAAEHQRLAAELERAARRHRVDQEELLPVIERLLDDWAHAIGATRPTATPLCFTTPLGWFRRFLTRNRMSHQTLDPNGHSEAEPVESTELSRPIGVAPLELAAVARLGKIDDDGAAVERRPEPAAPAAPSPSAFGSITRPDVLVRMLGPFEVVVNEKPIARWGSLKARALFQHLVLQPDRPVRRDILMELFWPGHSHTSARNNLNVSVYNLRRTLEQHDPSIQYILYKDGCYLLHPQVSWWIDRVEFLAALRDANGASNTVDAIEANERAVRLYRGPLFEDDSTGEWYLAEQRQLAELRAGSLEQLASLHLGLGAVAQGIENAQQALAVDPCRESAHRLLMRCYAEQHQQQLICRQFQLCKTKLHDELGVMPDAETNRLFDELTGPATSA
jgi:DNA-binding SARP family transcriptional activator